MKSKGHELERIGSLKNLPTLPHLLVKLMKACNDEKGDLSEVSALISKDPSLSGKILSLINSPYYGLPNQAVGIDQAVAYLGTNAVKNVAICASIGKAFDTGADDGRFNLRSFWWHSLRCALLCRLFAIKTEYGNPDEAFLAGLLHDIGKLVLWTNFPNEYVELLEKSGGRSDLLLSGEEDLVMSHNRLGARLLEHWHFQSLMSDSVLYHHETLERITNAFSLVKLVYVSNALSAAPSGDLTGGLEAASKLYGVSKEEIEEYLSETDEELEEVARTLDIDIEAPDEINGSISERGLEKQKDLQREVRDMSMLLGTVQNLLEARDQDAVLEVLYQGVHILFDTREVFFFLHDAENGRLVGNGVDGDTRSSILKNLIISMDVSESVIVSSLVQSKPLHTFDHPKNVNGVILDDQVIRFMGTEGMLCMPMVAHGEDVGVIVLGLSRAEYSHLTENMRSLKMFINQAALALRVEQQRGMELRKIQSERLGASSAMARKVVHEVNNPLSIMKNYLKILGMKLSDEGIAQDEIGILNEEIDRVAHILRALTSFSEDGVGKISEVDINGLISDLVKITKDAFLKRKIELHEDLSESLPLIQTDRDSLKQIIINLVKNASEALVGGGGIYLRTNHRRVGLSKEEDGSYVEIEISDDGPGIPDEMKRRLFEPFATSKGGGHSGLGLSIVHNLTKGLNGTIVCESEEGKGSSFKIELPVLNK